jgi:hypothetical protein
LSNHLIQYAFVAGEIAEKLLGRTDFEKYDLGLKKATNWFVDYRGGLTTRPGTLFCDWALGAAEPARMFPFQFSPDTANTYLVIFGDGWIRFMQDGGYVLQTAKNISAVTKADPGVVTATSHGFSNGDLVSIASVGGMTELNGRTFKISNVTTHTFRLNTQFEFVDGALDTSGYGTYTSGGTASRVYTVTHTYDPDDLPELQAKQIGDLLRLTHKDYPIKNLNRFGHTNWTLTAETFRGAAGYVAIPSQPTPSSVGVAGAGYVVTFVDDEGNESAPSYFVWLTDSVDFTVTAGSATITWTPVSGAILYRIYRTRVLANQDDLNGAMSFGLLGFAHGNIFTDNNIIPDFTVQPPLVRDPFSAGQVDYVEITNGGTGYNPIATNLSAGGPGTGFRGELIIVGGIVTGVRVLDHGSGYVTPPTLTVTALDGGSGAACTAHITDQTSPRASARFQQRQVYAGSEGFPLRVWGSQPGHLSNFNEGEIVSDDMSFEFDLDANDVAPIRHLLPVRGGLLAMTTSGVWAITGDQGRAVTPTNATAEPQTYVGVSLVEPLTIDTDILYVTAKESTVRLLTYNDLSKIYGGQDMSILSSHLFSQDNPIIRWSYQEAPYRSVWAVREDGSFCNFSIIKEQNVYAWTPCETAGLVREVVTLTENGQDTTYIVVDRWIRSILVRYIEVFGDREDANERNAEDAICVDSGLTQIAHYPAARLTAFSGDAFTEGVSITFITDSPVFVLGHVGDVIRVAGGKYLITAFVTASKVTCTTLRGATEVVPSTQILNKGEDGEWTLDDHESTFSGLWHLEGQTVSVLGDGVVLDQAVVVDGEITLDDGVTRCVIGLPFTCTAQTLPLDRAKRR